MDLLYPKKLHDRDFEFPILCEHSIPPNEKIKKLMSIVYDKKKLHHTTFKPKIWFRKRINIKKIHYVIYAKQSDFMKLY